jgi:DNA polymerase/3'-5' exonuclease PolX
MAKKTKRQLPQELRSLDQAAKVQHKELQQLYQPPEVIEADTRRRIAERFVILYFVILII